MEMTNIGKYVVSIELDRVDGGVRYYDAVLSKDGMEVKINKGCVGEKSSHYWGEKLEKLAKKLDILETRLEMVRHNFLSYSESIYQDKPKEGYAEQWSEAWKEMNFLEEWLVDLKGG
jgi:hypothetical protein